MDIEKLKSHPMLTDVKEFRNHDRYYFANELSGENGIIEGAADSEETRLLIKGLALRGFCVYSPEEYELNYLRL